MPVGLTVDDVMEKIGSYNRFQYRLLLVCGFMKIFGDGMQMMIPTFLSVEPPWRCKDNSSACNLTGIFKPGDKNYSYRCSIPRNDWEFDTSEFTSVVAEVGLIFLKQFSIQLKERGIALNLVLLKATLCDWSRNFAPSPQPIRCKPKTNRCLVTCVFPRLRSIALFSYAVTWFEMGKQQFKMADA